MADASERAVRPLRARGCADVPDRPDHRLDEAALQRLRELDPTGQTRLVERVLTAFQASIGRLLPQLQVARGRADMEGVRHVAHTLKSSSASVGAVALARICADVEASIRDQGFQRVPKLLDELEAELATVDRTVADALREPTPT